MESKVIIFPWKLHALLESVQQKEHDDIISWMPHGKSFKVHDKERFCKEIMPALFNSDVYKTFQRNLNLWGYKCLVKSYSTNKVSEYDAGHYAHDCFVRGNPDLCLSMKRVRIRGTGKKRSCSSSVETSTMRDSNNPESSNEEFVAADDNADGEVGDSSSRTTNTIIGRNLSSTAAYAAGSAMSQQQSCNQAEAGQQLILDGILKTLLLERCRDLFQPAQAPSHHNDILGVIPVSFGQNTCGYDHIASVATLGAVPNLSDMSNALLSIQLERLVQNQSHIQITQPLLSALLKMIQLPYQQHFPSADLISVHGLGTALSQIGMNPVGSEQVCDNRKFLTSLAVKALLLELKNGRSAHNIYSTNN